MTSLGKRQSILGAYMSEALLSLKEVSEIVSFKRNKIYELMDVGEFPRAKRVGRHVRWFRTEVVAWVRALKAEDRPDL
jgi:excisionase family DNA binding protein